MPPKRVDNARHLFRADTFNSPLQTTYKPKYDSAVAFMNSKGRSVSARTVVSGRRQCFVSGMQGFDVFTTTETKNALGEAIDKLVVTDPKNNSVSSMNHWKTIEMFFNAIPLIEFDDDTEAGDDSRDMSKLCLC